MLTKRVAAFDAIGAYEILGKIAEGPMGMVYKGRHRESKELVAIKVSNTTLEADPVAAQRCRQEFSAIHLLDHPRLLHAVDQGLVNSFPYVVMEFVDGSNLLQRINHFGSLKEEDAVAMIVQIADALHFVHEQGLIHRDVKPGNIVVTESNVATLIDFGLAKNTNIDLFLTATRSALGTPNFMAPEQFEDARNVDRRCDVYSLAATLYMAVTGKMPFEAKGYGAILRRKLVNDICPAIQLAPGLSKRTDMAIRMGLRLDPRDRPSSCLEFFSMLTGAASFPPLTPFQGYTTPAGRRACERRTAVRYSCDREAVCGVGFNGKGDWTAKLVNVSATGLGLLLSRTLRTGHASTSKVQRSGWTPQRDFRGRSSN